MKRRSVVTFIALLLSLSIAGALAQQAQKAGKRAGKAPRKAAGKSNKPAAAQTAAASNDNLTSAPDQSGEAQPRRAQPKKKKPISDKPVDPLELFSAMRISGDATYDSQPVIAETTDGIVYTAFIQYTEENKDQIVVVSYKPGAPMERAMRYTVVSNGSGQYIRPVLAASGNDLWCFWTKTEELQLSAIWHSRLENGAWTPAARLLPDEKRAHQNPEATGDADGRIAVAYQIHNPNGYDIAVREFSAGSWSDERIVSSDQLDDWDPTVAYDTAGTLHAAWSAFDKGDYDVYFTRVGSGQGGSTPKRISARGDYDMHPWLAAHPDGTVWISWDAVQIGRHGYSGNTTITGANLPDKKSTSTAEHGERTKWSGIEVRVIEGDNIRMPGKPREEITAPEGYQISHRALGKIAVTQTGEPWIFYRCLRQPNPVWEPGQNSGYFWELMGRPFQSNKWQNPIMFIESDGYLEEPAVFRRDDGIHIAYSSEHRRSTVRDVMYKLEKPEGKEDKDTTNPIDKEYDHHHDFDGFLAQDGDVYIARLQKRLGTPPHTTSTLLPLHQIVDKSVDERLTRQTGRYAVSQGGEKYNLYWGDTHRHSNVSRCSVGTEPTPDDLYRYGIDINLYDFVALSDHAEHTTDFYWWKQQKTADLYNIPGFLSVLYNYEWSMRYPEGHHNALFITRDNIKMNSKLGAESTMAGGWKVLSEGGYKAITAPHTSADPGMGTTWAVHDDRYQRVCEIFQACRGSYEYDGCPRQHVNATVKNGFYWNALEKGYKLGIICSTDHGYGCSYAVAYAKTNTRESVWQAIWDRRCYGSTTYGLVVDVRSGDHWMGEEWKSATAPKIDVYVRGAVPIRSVEILGRSKILHTVGSIEKPINQMEHRLSWSDPEWDSLQGEQWYYVRVIQTDDEMAWTSPMWVTKGE